MQFGRGLVLVVQSDAHGVPVLSLYSRPHKVDPPPRKRVFWEYWHKFGGRILLLLALINITLGLLLVVAPTGVWATWIVIFVLIAIAYGVMEVRLQFFPPIKDNIA